MECVEYANNYFGSSVRGHGAQWYDNDATTHVSLQSGCVACWSGGPGGFGHVGVVESWDGSTMTYSDANYNLDGKVTRRTDITEAAMKRLFGKTFTFQGYVIPD